MLPEDLRHSIEPGKGRRLEVEVEVIVVKLMIGRSTVVEKYDGIIVSYMVSST